jgi:hypothetical protein
MKNLIIILLCLTCTFSFAQNTTPAFDAHLWKAPYSLPLDGWGIERFLLPADFAPQIKYTGVEDIRFTKGWGDVKSPEYWSYAFLWFLDGKPEMNNIVIEKNLSAYYNGLIGRNIDKRKIPAEKITPVKTSITKIETITGDISTFSGTIEMLDYMEQKSITLNCIVHLKYCPGHEKTFIFHELSPQPATAAVWKTIDQLWKDFDCKAATAN